MVHSVQGQWRAAVLWGDVNETCHAIREQIVVGIACICRVGHAVDSRPTIMAARSIFMSQPAPSYSCVYLLVFFCQCLFQPRQWVAWSLIIPSGPGWLASVVSANPILHMLTHGDLVSDSRQPQHVRAP